MEFKQEIKPQVGGRRPGAGRPRGSRADRRFAALALELAALILRVDALERAIAAMNPKTGGAS